MKLAYYPGCVAKSTGIEYDISTRSVCKALGIELEEIEDWNCCGATHCSNELLAVGLSARNMARAKDPIMTSCSICYSNLRIAALRLEDKHLRERVNSLLDSPYKGADVRHVLEVIMEAMDEGSVVVPLNGLKVAPYYGCLLTRPSLGLDSPENPQILERFIALLGGKAVAHPCRTLCCGGPIFMSQEEAASRSAFQILRAAKSAGAEAVVTACPLCHLMLDAMQRSIESRYKEEIGLPVLYVTQLAGIALGLGPEELALDKNSVSPLALVDGINASVNI